MKITGQIEEIFSHAVALDQNGNMKNSIFVDKREVLIINYDHTILLKFKLRESEKAFDKPMSFKANDYDSNEFDEEDGKMVFYSNSNGYERKKVCGKSEHSHDEMKNLFKLFYKERKKCEKLTISNSIIQLLNMDLSHIEFSGKKGECLKLVQRNIYSGGIVEVKEKDGLFNNVLKEDFGPVGIRTIDFISLFSFQSSLHFHFPTKKEDYIIVESIDKKKRDMKGIISCCIYDEIINLKQSRNGG